MTAPFANLAAQIVDLREEIGQSVSAEIATDALLTTALNAALLEFNRMVPLWQLGSFATVADQQRYTEVEVGFPTGAQRPMRIFYPASDGVASDSIGPLSACGCMPFVEALNAGFPTEDFDVVSLEIAQKYYGEIQRAIGGRGLHMKDQHVWLDPVPSAVKTVYWFARVPLFATTFAVDTQWYSTFREFAVYKACWAMAHHQGEVVEARAGYGKSIRTAGGGTYMAHARDAKAAFYAGIRRAPKLYKTSV